MRKLLKCLLFITIMIVCHPQVLSAQQASAGSKDMTTEILRYVNEHRMGMGLQPLKMNDFISQVAGKHSSNMASQKVPFSHDGFDKRVTTINKQIKTANAWAENVAYGPRTARAVVDMWLQSPGHKKNIEGNYNLTGIGIARSGNGDMYYTEIFVNSGK